MVFKVELKQISREIYNYINQPILKKKKKKKKKYEAVFN